MQREKLNHLSLHLFIVISSELVKTRLSNPYQYSRVRAYVEELVPLTAGKDLGSLQMYADSEVDVTWLLL